MSTYRFIARGGQLWWSRLGSSAWSASGITRGRRRWTRWSAGRVELAGELLAESTRALRVLETSHPPTIYLPPQDVRSEWLERSEHGGSWCEFKGQARYVDAVVSGRRVPEVGWFYPKPSPGYEELRDHIAFYPGRVDAAWLDEERVSAQDGDFYGGWITADLVGPFKGPPGTLGW